MNDRLTTEDLYGKTPTPNASSQTPSSEATVTPSPSPSSTVSTTPPASTPTQTPDSEQASKQSPTLTYEETPVIEPIVDTSASAVPKLGAPHDLPRMASGGANSARSKSRSPFGILLFIILFFVGIWISSSVRQFFPSDSGETGATGKVTPSPFARNIPESTISAQTQWKSYPVVSGLSKKPIDGIRVFLPADVLSPICDGTNCASQGTYLPGGTRLTIAPRGTGQVLKDYRGTVVSDVNGTVFATKNILVVGRQSMEFKGEFTGRTISGYAFGSMRGVMIPLTDTTSLEINHFTPSGIITDFASDDALFDTILSKLEISPTVIGEKGAVLTSPTATMTPSKAPTPISTGSGILN